MPTNPVNDLLLPTGAWHLGRGAVLHPVSEAERANVALADCASRLRRAQELARQAGEAVRRTLRDVADAEAALTEARRRCARVPDTLARPGRGWS